MPSRKHMIALRLDPVVRAKLQVIADEEFRFMNKEVERLVLIRIAEYEAEHGAIPQEKIDRFMDED